MIAINHSQVGIALIAIGDFEPFSMSLSFVLLDHKFIVDSAVIEVAGSDRMSQLIVKMTGIQLQSRKPVGCYLN